jgi:hypothetical protein
VATVAARRRVRIAAVRCSWVLRSRAMLEEITHVKETVKTECKLSGKDRRAPVGML